VIAAKRAAQQPWGPAAAALLIGTLAIGAALLIPHAFSDPNSVDPNVIRLSAVAVILIAAAFLRASLAPARPVLLALVAITASFSLLSGAPQLLNIVLGSRTPSPAAQVFWASLAQLIVTLTVAGVAWRVLAPALRPHLRLARFGPTAAIAGVVGVALLVGVAMALPATLLGREGIQPVAVARDLPWLGPAAVLQALSQELQFRGLLMGALERVAPRWWANLGQAAFFGLSHLAVSYQGPVGPFVPATIAFGLLLGWIVQRSQSLWPAVLIHAAGDIAITVAVLPGLYGY